MSPIQMGSLSVNNSVTNISRLGIFWKLRLLFTISRRGPHTEIAGICFWGLKFGRYVNIYKKVSVLSLCFPCEKNSWNSKLFSDLICLFSTCWVIATFSENSEANSGRDSFHTSVDFEEETLLRHLGRRRDIWLWVWGLTSISFNFPLPSPPPCNARPGEFHSHHSKPCHQGGERGN